LHLASTGSFGTSRRVAPNVVHSADGVVLCFGFGEDDGIGLGLGFPVLAVGEEGLPIHEELGGLGEVFAELVEDSDAVGVDASPVAEFAGLQPVDLGVVQRSPVRELF